MKFSITIPAFKRRYLSEAIDSCLCQTYKDFEIVIVNDASPEDLDSVVNSYSDNRIRYYTNEKNFGAENVVDNWNKCLEYAKGEYIICMGDDDRLFPNCLEEYSKLINKYPNVDLFHGWTEIIGGQSEFVSLQEARPQRESVYSMIWHRREKKRGQWIGDFLFRTEKLRLCGGFVKFPMAWGSDDISCILVAKENGVVNSQRLLFQYRSNNLSITKSGDSFVKAGAIQMERAWYKSFLSVPPSNCLDIKFYQLICESEQRYYEKKYAILISRDIKNNYLRCLLWLGKLSKYQIKKKALLYAVFLALIGKS